MVFTTRPPSASTALAIAAIIFAMAPCAAWSPAVSYSFVLPLTSANSTVVLRSPSIPYGTYPRAKLLSREGFR